MDGYEWYKSGRVAVRHSECEVVGTDTLWLKDGIKRGDIFILDNQVYEIDEVTSNTALNLSKPYTGDSAGGKEYGIITRYGEVLQADIALKLQQAITKFNEQERIITAIDERTKFLETIHLYADGDEDLAQGDVQHTAQTLTSLPIATPTRLGGVKIGKNINVTEDGEISTEGASIEDADKQTLQRSLEKVATTPADMNAMMNKVFSNNSGS